MKIENMINLINAINEKLTKSKNFASQIYKDEPIIKTANQIKQSTPKKIQLMREIAACNMFFSDKKIFYEQAKFMEDYEDDYEDNNIDNYEKYFPTYQTFDNKRLRQYFSWRTKLRRGDLRETSISYAFMYIYELINGIGCKGKKEGFYKLKDFCNAYKKFDNRIDKYAKLWLKDYVIYYNLDKSLIEEFNNEDMDKALTVLINYKEYNNNEIFKALNKLSSYDMEKSKFYKQYPEDIENIAAGVFIALSEYLNTHRKNGLCDRIFGLKAVYPYSIFNSAVFYDREKYSDYEYVFNDVHKYRCKNQQWWCENYFSSGKKNSELGDILKAVDCQMRIKYDFKYLLKPQKTSKFTLNIIEKEIDKYLEIKKKTSVVKIDIDVSKLKDIRMAADITRDKLIADEEQLEFDFSGMLKEDYNCRDKENEKKQKEDIEINYSFEISENEKNSENKISKDEKNSQNEKFPQNEKLPQNEVLENRILESKKISQNEISQDEILINKKILENKSLRNKFSESKQLETDSGFCGLTKLEYEFLKCLLYENDYAAFLSKQRIMPSIIADSINEKMFDRFLDTIIIFNEDKPEIIEDYIKELKEMLKADVIND